MRQRGGNDDEVTTNTDQNIVRCKKTFVLADGSVVGGFDCTTVGIIWTQGSGCYLGAHNQLYDANGLYDNSYGGAVYNKSVMRILYAGSYGTLVGSYNSTARTGTPAGAFHIIGENAKVPLVVDNGATPTVDAMQIRTSAGAPIFTIDKNGGLVPASMADATAANGTVYYSTDAGKLVYKDAGGTVNPLY